MSLSAATANTPKTFEEFVGTTLFIGDVSKSFLKQQYDEYLREQRCGVLRPSDAIGLEETSYAVINRMRQLQTAYIQNIQRFIPSISDSISVYTSNRYSSIHEAGATVTGMTHPSSIYELYRPEPRTRQMKKIIGKSESIGNSMIDFRTRTQRQAGDVFESILQYFYVSNPTLLGFEVQNTEKTVRKQSGKKIRKAAANERLAPLEHFFVLNALMAANPANSVPLITYRGVPPTVDVRQKTAARVNNKGGDLKWFERATIVSSPEASFAVGDQVTFARLLSTSQLSSAANRFIQNEMRDPKNDCNACCMLRFQLPVNYPRLYLEPYTVFKGEEEILLPAFVLRNPAQWRPLFEQYGAWNSSDIFKAMLEKFWDVFEPARFLVTKDEVVSVAFSELGFSKSLKKAELQKASALRLRKIRIRTLVPVNGF